MTQTISSRLFTPFTIGNNLKLQHRVVLAPLTRTRTTPSYAQLPFTEKYYAQRASTPGTLLIAEGTIIHPKALGLPNSPGIWSQEQIDSWKKVTEAVHAKGSYIFLQLYDGGRVAPLAALKELDPSYDVRGPSKAQLETFMGPRESREMTLSEIKENVQHFVDAAKAAVEQAGFDGVEIHAANGFLLDQFQQEVSNFRTDEYGGSIENRARFPLGIIDAVVNAIGEERTAFRISPWSTLFGMGMKDPVPYFTYFISTLKSSHPKLAFLHVIEPRMVGSDDVPEVDYKGQSNDFVRKLWAPLPYISAGGYSRETAIEIADANPNELVAFGRYFISNPDLPRRLQDNIPLGPYNRDTFYTNDEVGYTDYPFSNPSTTSPN